MGFRCNGVRQGDAPWGHPSHPSGQDKREGKATDLEAAGTFGENSGRGERHAAEGQRRQRREGALCESQLASRSSAQAWIRPPTRENTTREAIVRSIDEWDGKTSRGIEAVDGSVCQTQSSPNGKSRAENPIRFRSATESGASTGKVKGEGPRLMTKAACQFLEVPR